MTTIAYRDGVLAADTQLTSGNSYVGSMSKIARNDRGDLAAACGTPGYNASFMRWFTEGEKGDAPEPQTQRDDGTDVAVIFRRDGKVLQFEDHGLFTLEATYYALGSGSDVALGAMHAGASAVDAVHAAIAHDIYTGGTAEFLLAEQRKD